MIADVVGSYLDTLEEREFDAPFIALLRSLGFRDIHFLHGSFEFGKDFIAKGDDQGAPAQFSFQTKAGNLGLTDWNACRGQIDMLRTNSLAHPAFDGRMPRKAVFVTTGRLVGGAALAAQQYAQHLAQFGEIGFVTWDRETLVELITKTPEIGLASEAQGAFLELIGQIDQKRIEEKEIELFSQRWLSATGSMTLHTSALEAAVIANRLRRNERIDLACFVGLCLIRAAWARTHAAEPVDDAAMLTANTGRQLFRHYAWDLFDRCGDDLLDPLNMVRTHHPMAAHVTYPVRCLRLVEILGLLGLLESEAGDPRSQNLRDFLIKFIDNNPGTAHPISDRWAVSLIPPVLMLGRAGHAQPVRRLLQNVIKWVADRYDSDSRGLAGPDSSPEEELEYLLGEPFEHIETDRRAESYIATVVLDLAAMLEMGDLFNIARNEFLAVDAVLPVVEVPDTPGQYIFGGEGACFTPNMEYADSWEPADGWRVAPHHTRAVTDYYLQRIGRWWDLLALSAVLRDRHFLETCRHFLA
ncbi:MAG: hypothetical protein AAB403_11895 [Planctomycetota bacterium]